MKQIHLGEVYRPAIPLAYVQLILDYAQRRGVAQEQLVQGLGLYPRLFNTPDARVSRHDAGAILLRAIRLTGNLGVGFEMGLLSNITTHGLVGYGLMASPTLREGIEFGRKFLPTRLPYLRLDLYIDGRDAVVSVVHSVELGVVRNYTDEFFLVGVYRLLLQASFGLLKEENVELWCDTLQPKYYSRYREHLPKMLFGKVANQVRFPASMLEMPLPMANAIAVSQVTAQLERELAVLDKTEDLLARIRATLTLRNGNYPKLEEVAQRLNMSPRTIRRKLASHGVSFRKILDDVLRREAIALLNDSEMSIEQVAARLGYSDPGNFTRAFHRWMLLTPSTFRDRRVKLGNSLAKAPCPEGK
jgi:AraC-like DNA-binding protein